ncbi:YhgE/Pip family protein [Nocardioides sp. GXQ0305]|uniref:YhgE/Pip domain-containing protein n=1 Tax=Nocardioides sp. GXQ0305 TaxID=3423912 RepID=UPI003D7DF24F
MADTTSRTRGRHWPTTLTVTVLLPLLAAWVLVWSTAGRQEALDRVPVAIVNDDTILTDPQPMAAGRALSASLTSPSSGSEQLAWTLTDADDASAGLRDGTYYAVLTIPSDFSAAIVSTGSSSPTSGQLTLQSNAAASQTVPFISNAVVTAAADALGTQVTQSYLGQVYDGFNQLASANQQAAQGADQLAGGTEQLAAGAGELDSGAQELASSLGEVASGAAELETGTAGASAGASELRQGSRELAGGVGRLTAAQGGIARDAGRLARSAGTYADRARSTVRPTALIARGSARLAVVADRLREQMGDLVSVCRESGARPRFCARLRVARARSVVLDVGGQIQARTSAGVADGARKLAKGAEELAAADRALATGTREVADAGRRLDRSADSLAGGAAGLATAAAEVDTAAGTLAGGTAATSEAGSSLASGSETLSSSAAETDQGAQKLRQGLDKQARKSPTYSKSQKKALEATVSQPVLLSHSTQHQQHDNGWLLGAIVGVILWLAALAGAARADVSASRRFALAPVSSRRIAMTQLLPVLGLAVLQGLAVLLALALTRVSVESAVSLTVFSLLAAVCFSAIGYAFRLALGAAGVALFGLFLLVQIAALANVLPLETAPGALQSLNGLMPLTVYVDGANRLVSGGEVGSVAGAVAVMVLWGVVALISTTVVVRRQRMLPATA